MVTTPSVSSLLEMVCGRSDEIGQNGEEHQGGYSTHIRAQEKFVFHIPEQLKSEDAASMYVPFIPRVLYRKKNMLISGCAVD
jgi:D-arabinose 1-dehydrogenase-like Zn-dependent alcohol dehydrogenase